VEGESTVRYTGSRVKIGKIRVESRIWGMEVGEEVAEILNFKTPLCLGSQESCRCYEVSEGGRENRPGEPLLPRFTRVDCRGP